MKNGVRGMTGAVSTGTSNFALATVVTSSPAPDASLIVSDFIRRSRARRPMRLRLTEGPIPGTSHTLMQSIQSLSRLRQLEKNWDGVSAKMLTDDACETALRLLVALAMPAPPSAQLVPLTDGGVQLEWHVAGNDVEIEIDPKGDIHAFIAASDNAIVLNRELPPSLLPTIISEIKRYLTKMSRLLHEAV
ncbi:MAG: hypothetical protein ACRD2L_16970 [Terriglobia bacterium]